MLGIHHYLWRLVPANPILLRVVETGGRRPRDLFIRCAYLGLLILVVVISLMSRSSDIGGGSLSSLAKTSANLFQVMSYLQLGLVALLAPVFTAGAITQEKDSQTYDILLATPLSNGQIVLGSLLSRLFFVVTLLVSGIPIFSITQIFGGVSIRSIVISFGIAAATAFVTGALAMAIATFKVGTRRTIFSFYLFIVIFMVGGVMLDRMQWSWVDGPVRQTQVVQNASAADRYGRNSGYRGDVDVDNYPDGAAAAVPAATQTHVVNRARISWFTAFNPFLALRVVFRDDTYAPPGIEDLPEGYRRWPVSYMLTNPTGFYISLMFTLGLVLVLPSIVLLRRMAQTSTTWQTALLRKLHVVRDARTRKPRAVWNNPIAWREAKTKASAARATVLRYGFIAAGLIAAIYLAAQYARVEEIKQPVGQGDFKPSQAYGSVLGTVRLPGKTAADSPADYIVDRNLTTRISVLTDGGGNEGIPFKLADLKSPMGVVGYEVCTPVELREARRFDLANAYPSKMVLKELTLRPPARGEDPYTVRKYLLGLCIVEFAVILLIVTNAAASTVTREKEDGTLDLFLSSPITSRYYIWGKLRGLVSFVLPLVAVPVASVAILLAVDAVRMFRTDDPTFRWLVLPEALVLMPLMLVIVSAFAAILGMQMSLRCRTTVTAVMSSVGIVVGICAAMGFCGFKFVESSDNPLAMVVGGFSPFTLMQVLIDPYSVGGGSGRLTDEDLTSRRITLGIFAVMAIGAYVGVVWQMYSGMVKNFDMTVRKQSR